MSARRVEASQIGVGHTVLHLGAPHHIVTVAPHPELRDWRVAYDNDGWTVALVPGQHWWIDARGDE